MASDETLVRAVRDAFRLRLPAGEADLGRGDSVRCLTSVLLRFDFFCSLLSRAMPFITWLLTRLRTAGSLVHDGSVALTNSIRWPECPLTVSISCSGMSPSLG